MSLIDHVRMDQRCEGWETQGFVCSSSGDFGPQGKRRNYGCSDKPCCVQQTPEEAHLDATAKLEDAIKAYELNCHELEGCIEACCNEV